MTWSLSFGLIVGFVAILVAIYSAAGFLAGFINRLANIRNWFRARSAKIDVNAKCPACGNRNGKLQVVIVELENQHPVPHIQHHCQVCFAFFYEDTVMKPDKWWKEPPAGENK